jgi:putative ABC transport system permease protein
VNVRDLRDEVRRRLGPARLEPTREAEVAQELAQHLEDRLAELRARGVSEAEAEAAVLAELDGSPALAREIGRVAPRAREPIVAGAPRRGTLADLGHDLRFAARGLTKSPGFAAVTLLSLALGIGATTAFFQLLDALHLRVLPVAEPQELVQVKISNRTWASGYFQGWHPDLSNPLWEGIRAQQQAFSGAFAWGDRDFNLAPAGEVRRARGLYVSGETFQVLGVRPFLGRLFTPADDRRGCGTPGAVVSHGFWERELGADPGAPGRTITLDGHRVAVIGVTPPGFFGLEMGKTFDVAVPVCMEATFRAERTALDMKHAWWLTVIGRLKPGWTVERATAHLETISPALFGATVPPGYKLDTQVRYMQYKLGATPGGTGLSELRVEYSKPLTFLLAIAGLVLLIACANLANLLLARASAREREIAVRLALGASRGRLVRQLMAESLLLAVLGAALGLLVATWIGETLVSFLSTRGNRFDVPLDPQWRVLVFTVGLAGLTCVLFGLAPALRASRTDLGLVLKATTQSTPGRERFGLRRVLVASQMALSFVLLVSAILFSRSLLELVTVDPGFRRDGVTILNLDLRPLDLAADRRTPVKYELLERLRAAPGVTAAASASVIPMSGNTWNHDVWPDGAASREPRSANFSRISDGYFETLGTPLLAGRDFDGRDTLSTRPVAIVNERLAREILKVENPVGRLLRREASSSGKDPETVYEIVGLVRDTKYGSLRDENEPLVYVPATQDRDPWENVEVLVRSDLPLPQLVPSLKQAASRVSPSLLMDFDALDRVVRDSLLRERLLASLSGFFGLLAALLASVGLYGVVSYSVARRTHEIGIRMALGADRRRVTGMILRETFLLLGVGVLAGGAIALVATRAATAFLYGIPPHDPLTFAIALGLMTLVSLIASLFPARRAARVDPIVALREE